MNKKVIFVILGLLLLLAGAIYSVPALVDVLNYLKKNYTLSGWGKNTYFPLRLLISGGGVILGALILIIGLKAKKAVFRLAVFALILIFAIFSGVYSYKFVLSSTNTTDKEVSLNIDSNNGIRIDVPFGSSTTTIANMLKEKGIIKYPYIFKLMSKLNGYDGTYQSGTHFVSTDLDYDKLMKVLSGKPYSVSVLLTEGMTLKQIEDKLLEKKLISKDKFEKVVNTDKFDYMFLKGLPDRSNRLEGYLFPDTYEFGMGEGEKDIIKKMLDDFNKKFKPEYYDSAKKLGMTVDKIIILASIIEGEAAKDEERNKIAGVFYNRLNNKDKALRKLQSCATIQYILKNEGITREKNKIFDKDTKIVDPYNTYLNEGLPPGPICSPGIRSIEAALNPEKTDYLYFVAKGDGSGTHQFSKTLKEHQAASKKYGVN